jgi:hypothetical protein
MSLINDALKRAAQKPAAPPSAPELAAGLRPAEERPPGFPFLTLLIVFIPLIALGVWFLAKGLQLNEQPTPAPAETTIAARALELAATPVHVPESVVATVATQPATENLPKDAAYKLQGIFWRPSKPSAVVNGKILYIGDRVEQARVTAIDQESVTLTVNGESKVLLLRTAGL